MGGAVSDRKKIRLFVFCSLDGRKKTALPKKTEPLLYQNIERIWVSLTIAKLMGEGEAEDGAGGE